MESGSKVTRETAPSVSKGGSSDPPREEGKSLGVSCISIPISVGGIGAAKRSRADTPRLRVVSTCTIGPVSGGLQEDSASRAPTGAAFAPGPYSHKTSAEPIPRLPVPRADSAVITACSWTCTPLKVGGGTRSLPEVAPTVTS